jgi:hypothetical protein
LPQIRRDHEVAHTERHDEQKSERHHQRRIAVPAPAHIEHASVKTAEHHAGGNAQIPALSLLPKRLR